MGVVRVVGLCAPFALAQLGMISYRTWLTADRAIEDWVWEQE